MILAFPPIVAVPLVCAWRVCRWRWPRCGAATLAVARLVIPVSLACGLPTDGPGGAPVEAKSREWLVRCPHCDHEQSAWDRGWTIWKGAGRGWKYRRCPVCGQGGWYAVTRVRAWGGQPGARREGDER